MLFFHPQTYICISDLVITLNISHIQSEKTKNKTVWEKHNHIIHIIQIQDRYVNKLKVKLLYLYPRVFFLIYQILNIDKRTTNDYELHPFDIQGIPPLMLYCPQAFEPHKKYRTQSIKPQTPLILMFSFLFLTPVGVPYSS